MAIILPPCPPNCENRKPACQGECEAYKEYRAALDEENLRNRQARERKFYWTEGSKNAFMRKKKRGSI